MSDNANPVEIIHLWLDQNTPPRIRRQLDSLANVLKEARFQCTFYPLDESPLAQALADFDSVDNEQCRGADEIGHDFCPASEFCCGC
jgi:hypothetical protein